MPKYKKRDPEFTAIQFTGSNIREVMDELGPGYKTSYNLDLEDATSFTFQVPYDRRADRGVRKGYYVVKAEDGTISVLHSSVFESAYEPVRRAGRPPKEKK